MTPLEMEKGFQEIWKLFAETDKKFKETAENIERTDKKLDKLIGTWGTFVEGLVEPAAIRMFQERGFDVEDIMPNRKLRKNGQVLMEIDVFLSNGEYAILIEVKTTLRVDDVKEHIERLHRFKECFPQYADKKVIGAVAGIKIHEDADQFAINQGLFVIVQSGDSVRILNDEIFQPKVY